MTDRKKPGVAFWATVVVVVVLVAYPLSFGPACWISSRTGRGAPMVSAAYQPIFQIWWTDCQFGSPPHRSGRPWWCPHGLGRAVAWYANALSDEKWCIYSYPKSGYRWDRVKPGRCDP